MRWQSFLKPELDRTSRTAWLLVSAWCLGLIVGICLAAEHCTALARCLRGAAFVPASGSVCFTVYLPLMFACMASLTVPACCAALCVGQGVLMGVMLAAAAAAFSGCPVLGGILVLFPAICFSPVLLWYWCRRILLGTGSLVRDSVFCAVIGFVICTADVWMISPFLVRVINF